MIKLKQIVNSQSSLKKLLELNLPIKIAYVLSKLANKIQPELNIYEEQRIKLVKELGELIPDTDNYQVKESNIGQFAEEIGKLQDIDVNLTLFQDKPFEKFKIEDLGEISITPQDLANLNWIFE